LFIRGFALSSNPETRLRPLLVTAHVYNSDSSCSRIFTPNVQVFLAVPGEPKNIILTRATELAPPEGIAGRQERDERGSTVDTFLQVRDSWRGQGTNWGNLLGGAAWPTSNMADFVAATKKANRDFSLRSE
jgi:hypothetical protein